VGLFQWFSTKRKLDSIETDIAGLKRTLLQMEQEWDAVQARVSKTLRRIARAEQAADETVKEEFIEKSDKLPLTTIGASPERMEKIRRQLAEKGRA
jgi:hypothetical protein